MRARLAVAVLLLALVRVGVAAEEKPAEAPTAPTYVGDDELRRSAVAMRDELMQRMRDAGSLPLDFYPAFVRDDEPASGFAIAAGAKRFGTEYWAARNRIGVLVETHSWKDYPTRVRITSQRRQSGDNAALET